MPRRRLTRVPRLLKNPNEAKVVETLVLGNLLVNTPTKIQLKGFTGCDRAQSIARQFDMYRVSKIELEVRPFYDSYTNTGTLGGTVAGSVPRMFFTLCRSGDYPAAPTETYFAERGCKARSLDKPFTYSFKPNAIAKVDQTSTISAGNIKMTPWLSCDNTTGSSWTPDTTLLNGGVLGAFALTGGAGNGAIAELLMRVHFEFKGAHVQSSATEGGEPIVDPLA